MGISVRIAGINEVKSALKSTAREMGWSMSYAGLKAAKFMCFDMLVFTPPFVASGGGGNTPESGRVGLAAVDRDIRKIFAARDGRTGTVGGLLLQRLAHAGHIGDQSAWYDAQEAAKGFVFQDAIVNKLVSDTNPVRAFEKAKNYFSRSNMIGVSGDSEKGVKPLTIDQMRPIHDRVKRINRQGRTKITKGQGNYYGMYLVQDKGTLSAYIKERQVQVGNAKAAWLNVLQTLPSPPPKKGEPRVTGTSKGVAAYISRHANNGEGYQRAYYKTNAFSIVMGNMIGDSDGIATRNKVFELVYGRAIQRLEADLQNKIEADARKFNQGI